MGKQEIGSPPAVGEVARRLAVLKGVVRASRMVPPRGFLNALLKTEEKRREFTEKMDGLREKLRAALRRWDAWEAATARERGILEKDVLEISEREQIDASWRLEAAQALMWSLGLVEALPAYDLRAKSEILKGVEDGKRSEEHTSELQSQ